MGKPLSISRVGVSTIIRIRYGITQARLRLKLSVSALTALH